MRENVVVDGGGLPLIRPCITKKQKKQWAKATRSDLVQGSSSG